MSIQLSSATITQSPLLYIDDLNIFLGEGMPRRWITIHSLCKWVEASDIPQIGVADISHQSQEDQAINELLFNQVFFLGDNA